MTDPVAEMTEDERVEQAKQEHIAALRKEHAQALADHLNHPHTQLSQLTKDLQRKEHAQALADHLNHPHTQLSQLTKDLQTTPALDVAGRIGQLNSAVQRLITIIKAHTPQPPPHPGEFNAEGIDSRE